MPICRGWGADRETVLVMGQWLRWVVRRQHSGRPLVIGVARGRHRGALLSESEEMFARRIAECAGGQRGHTQQRSEQTAGYSRQHLLAQRDFRGRVGVGLVGSRCGRSHCGCGCGCGGGEGGGLVLSVGWKLISKVIVGRVAECVPVPAEGTC